MDVLNPSVVRRDGVYWNFYSGFDGRVWHTGAAVSDDGVRWTRQGRVLSPNPRSWEGEYIAANGSALLHAGELFYWYQAGPRESPSLGLARSRNGRHWTRHGAPVLGPGPRGSWDERGVADPYVIRMEPWFYMYFLGQDRARRQRLGVARSSDGVRWEKLRTNPVVELGEPGAFDEVGLGEPAVWQAEGWWWMLYTGRDRREHRRLGLARSRDGVAWERLPGAMAGAEAWNSTVLCDPAIEVVRDGVRVWFGGGDAPSPDENLHGQIGLGMLRPVRGANLDK
ncbi:MAG TPA: hypothetical protein VN442_15325 [Bryobacteraceae bacterium]|nr:hypothetical protein [Bryobacteraceae bacterium]